MLPYPDINPVFLKIGPLSFRWYGLMYLIGFLVSYVLVRRQISTTAPTPAEQNNNYELLDKLVIWLVLGVVLGGRLGYVLFYNLEYFLSHPLEILATWQGGMSFHGGMLGTLCAGWLFAKKYGLNYWQWADRIIVTAPIGLGLGRIGNFINGELFGRPSDVPWAMVFPSGGLLPRHPSQLYEAFLEGIVLFAILWPTRYKKWPHGRKTALFFMSYSVVRFFVEFFREPDPQLGFVMLGMFSMGQCLSVALFLIGLFLWHIRRA